MAKQFHDQVGPVPQQAFRFRWEVLEPGDVICSTVPADPVSRLIRALTWSEFSHVSLCVETKGCIEANENVARFSLLHVGCRSPKNVTVIRLRDDAAPGARDIRLRAGEAGLQFLGQPYWTSGAFKSLFRARPRAQQPGAFCSHLVASAYSAAGLELVAGLSPQHITPRHIAECALFEDISQAALEEIPPAYIEPYFEYLDAPRAADTLHLLEVKIGLGVCSDVADEFKALVGLAPRSLIEAVVTVGHTFRDNVEAGRRLDALLTASLHKHRFVEEMTRRLPTKPFYDPDQLVAWLLSDAATPANVEHLLSNCTSIDVGSDEVLHDRLEWSRAYDEGAKMGMESAHCLADLAKAAYGLNKRLIESNRLCVRILEAFQKRADFISLAPGGDPRDRLTAMAETRGTFVLQADPPRFEARKYAGRLWDALQAYVVRAGANQTGLAVTVWELIDGALVFLPPPPLEEGSWFLNPFIASTLEVEELGPSAPPDR